MNRYFHAASGRYFVEGDAFTIDGELFAPNWLTLASDEDKTARGLQIVRIVGETKDPALYVVTEELVGDELRIINTPRSAEEIEALRRARVPQTVTRFQARAALHLAGHLEAVETLMANPEAPVMARLAWTDAQEFRRTSPTVLAMSQALGLTDDQLDELFTAAAQIEA